jgi:hypothetical protein
MLQNKRFLQTCSDIPEDGTFSVTKRVECVQVLTNINIGLISVYEFSTDYYL